ncbi:MAG: hypothetical protein HQ467_03800 [Acidimicrobiaceae bacterium]|nr:hypothetical protein [Acidimicrobiaceae bacterium]
MITTYGFSIATANKNLREAAIDAVFHWLDDEHPHEKRTNATPVNIRHSANDPIFRVDVLEQDSRQAAARGTTVTLITSKDELYFDLRRTLRPTKPALLPRRTIDRPEPRLNKLILEIVKLFKVRDAEKIIDAEITIANDQLGGESLAAFADAPGRRLPIVIEVIVGKPAAVTSSTTARQLVGIAHVAHVASHVAEEAFNNLYGARIISSSWITVVWPRGAAPENFHQQDDDELVNHLIAASVASLPILKTPPPKSKTKQDFEQSQKPPVSQIAEITSARDYWQEEYQLLYENLVDSDRKTAEIVEAREIDRDKLVAILTSPRADAAAVSNAQNPNYLARVNEAVKFASITFKNLIFHPRSISSSAETELMNGRRILNALFYLDQIAANLKNGKVLKNNFLYECSQQISNFVPTIGEVAINNFAQDYSIEWKGENVLAKPHIRCGDARIHFYHDTKTNEIVIAYIGRHLRDKSTN